MFCHQSCKANLKNFILFFLGLFIFTGCAKGVLTENPYDQHFYSSDKYIVFRLFDDETPRRLAEHLLGDENKFWQIEDANENAKFKKGETIIIPKQETGKGGLAPDGYQVVPILNYHQFEKSCQSSLCTSIDVFEKHMRYLKTNGFRVITFQDLIDFMQYRRSIPKKSVIITIDDGFRTAYTIASPILKKHGFTATLFIYTDFIGSSSNAITWDELRKLKEKGFEIGSHSLSHDNLVKRKEGEDLASYVARVTREMRESKKIIDRRLRQNTVVFSYPFGDYSKKVIEICEDTGYKVAVTANGGSNPFFTDPMTLKRNQILERDMNYFISRLKIFQKLRLD